LVSPFPPRCLRLPTRWSSEPIGTPPCDRHVAQQIRVDLVAGLRFSSARTAIKRLYRHPLHQRLERDGARSCAPRPHQQAAQHPRTGEGNSQMRKSFPIPSAFCWQLWHKCRVRFGIIRTMSGTASHAFVRICARDYVTNARPRNTFHHIRLCRSPTQRGYT
jgi:hypothetical protein